MARCALIKDGKVVTVIVVDADFAVLTESANAGDLYDPATGRFTAVDQHPLYGEQPPVIPSE